MNHRLRRVVTLVAVLNLLYFGIEFGVARKIGSVSLFADSVDFLEDALLNVLIVVALRWGSRERARLGMGLAILLLVPGIATLWTAWEKIHAPYPPTVSGLTLTGTGALLVNLACAWMLARYRAGEGSVVKAAFLSSRNDVFANLAILLSGALTAITHSGWSDLIVGLGIALMNADSAREVWRAARTEHMDASAPTEI